MSIRSIAAAIVLLFVAAWVIAQEALPIAELPAADPLAAAPPTDARHYSYAIGLQIGKDFREQATELDAESVLAGLKDGLADAEPKYSEEICMIALQRMTRDQAERAVARNKELQALAAKFLAENAKAVGVVVRPSGLQYKVLASGRGPSPKATDIVRVAYRGTFVDGTMFDESGDEPAVFPVNRVIDGWTEALQLMKVGDKWQLVVPSDLAYGPEGGNGMPPDATLIFEVELLGIE